MGLPVCGFKTVIGCGPAGIAGIAGIACIGCIGCMVCMVCIGCRVWACKGAVGIIKIPCGCTGSFARSKDITNVVRSGTCYAYIRWRSILIVLHLPASRHKRLLLVVEPEEISATRVHAVYRPQIPAPAAVSMNPILALPVLALLLHLSMRVQSSDSVGMIFGTILITLSSVLMNIYAVVAAEKFQCALMVPALLGLALIAAKTTPAAQKMQHDFTPCLVILVFTHAQIYVAAFQTVVERLVERQA